MVNVNSLMNKVNYVSHLIDRESLDLVAVSETWLTGAVSSSFVSIPEFDVVRGDVRGDVRKHGVCIYVSKKLKYVPLNVDIPNVTCIQLVDMGIFVLSVYRPPSYNNIENATLINFLSDFCLGKEVVVLGDFNLPSLRWASYDLLNDYVAPLDLEFFSCFMQLGLNQWVQEGTFLGSNNILDLVLTI